MTGPAVVGVGALSHDPDVERALRMRRFHVVPGRRRHGVGRTLARELLELAFEHVEVITGNAAASGAAAPFWESLGFERSDVDGVTHLLRRP